MPTRTHAQTLALISAINAEIDFSFNDQLSYFARRFRDGLQAQVNQAEALKNQQIQDLIYTYAQTYENGLIIKTSNQVFNEALQQFIPFEINETDLATIESEATTIIADTEALELTIEPLFCPECPRLALLSDDFKEAFAGIFVPDATYTDEDFTSYTTDINDDAGCFYLTPNPVTVYKDSAVGKYYIYNDRQPFENTYAPDGYYFTASNTYYQITNGVLNPEPFTCDIP